MTCTLRASYPFVLLPQLLGCGVLGLGCLVLAFFWGWALLLTLFPLGLGLWRYLDWQTTYYTLTPDAVTKYSGILFKNSEAIPTHAILKRNVSVYLPGPDIGNVVLETAGQSGNNLQAVEGDLILRNVPMAPAIAETIYYLGGGPPPAAAQSPQEALVKLQALIDGPQSPIQPSSSKPKTGLRYLYGGLLLVGLIALSLSFALLVKPQSPTLSRLSNLPTGPLYGFGQVPGQPPSYWIARITSIQPKEDGTLQFALAWAGGREPGGQGSGNGNGEGRITADGKVHLEIAETLRTKPAAPSYFSAFGGSTSTPTQTLILDGALYPQAQGGSFLVGHFMQRGMKFHPNCTWVLGPTPPKGWQNP